MTRKMLLITFSDGRNQDILGFDAARDTPETVELLIGKMKDNGWYPVKGSDRQVVIENGVIRPYTERPKLRPVWKVA